MKHIPYLLAIVSVGAASCVAQPANPPTAAAPPTRPAHATPTAAAVPAAPPPPAAPEAPDEADIHHEAEKIKIAGDQLRLAGDQLYKARFDLIMNDPFNERDDANQTLVLPHDLSDAKAQADTEEDLKVMAHILQKASRSPEERSANGWGIVYRSPFGSSAALRNLYLEGYGAVFFLSVNYSLTPPPAKTEDAEPKTDRDTEWENARREISEPRASRVEGGGSGGGGGSSGRSLYAPANSEPPYDPERVETLQKNLAQALKNATHIRALAKDESITIVVSARNPSGMKIPPTRTIRRGGSEAPATPPRPPRLTMRAKKSDIEAFQNDKMSLDEFRKRLTVSIS